MLIIQTSQNIKAMVSINLMKIEAIWKYAWTPTGEEIFTGHIKRTLKEIKKSLEYFSKKTIKKSNS